MHITRSTRGAARSVDVHPRKNTESLSQELSRRVSTEPTKSAEVVQLEILLCARWIRDYVALKYYVHTLFA